MISDNGHSSSLSLSCFSFMFGPNFLKHFQSILDKASDRTLSLDLTYFTDMRRLNSKLFKVSILSKYIHLWHFEALLLTMFMTPMLSQKLLVIGYLTYFAMTVCLHIMRKVLRPQCWACTSQYSLFPIFHRSSNFEICSHTLNL